MRCNRRSEISLDTGHGPTAAHRISRGDRREPIFDDDDRHAFLAIAARERFDACLLAYCLMGNHFYRKATLRIS